MQFRDLYEKPIDRSIDPVVKAGNDASLANELDEFVMTPEIAQNLQAFFDEYNDPDATGNGAWISGFFGCGKSHLLKVLAVTLEDRPVEGRRASEYLRPKLRHDPSLEASLTMALERHPSESILFNVDSSSPNRDQAQTGSLLTTFMRAFNRHCGYFDGNQLYLAKMEHDLDRDGRLEAFRSAVQSVVGKPWEEIRSAAKIYSGKITAAWEQACDETPGTHKNVLEEYQRDFDPSIQDFANQVADYLEHRRSRQPGFRLNFFVDEVGQFIADSPQRMVNLQSIAESLNTACKGEAWVVVTSQENVEAVIGDMSARSANDFSKIQARFKVKMKLSSKDACAVIKQRLLAKTDEASCALGEVYARRKDDFRVLFDFTDGSRRYKYYEDEQDFVDAYPFVPYQFDLFTTAMRELSNYNAFTGSYHSVGERSMLSVFQEVAKGLAKDERNTVEAETLATFDAMFDGLRSELKSEVCGQIAIAEKHLNDKPLAVRVLKALLLVKYCRDFKATPANLRVLLCGSLIQNAAVLERDIREALAELERQRYIRPGVQENTFEYLTDEEKDAEEEIRAIEVSMGDVRKQLAEVIKEVAGPQRATYKNGKFEHVFTYALRIDGEAVGSQNFDLTVDFLTERPAMEGELVLCPTKPKTLSVELLGAESFMNRIATFLKTRKYVNLKTGSEDVARSIVEAKREANVRLGMELRREFKELLANATYNAGGMDVTSSVRSGGKEGALERGVQQLINRSYTGLQQLKCNYTDDDVRDACLREPSPLDVTPEYVETVYGAIGLLSGAVGGITVGGDNPGSLTKRFSRNEYGWPEVAVRHAVAELAAAGRIEVRRAGSLLEKAALAKALKSKADAEKLVVQKAHAIDPERLLEIEQGYRRLVGTSPTKTETKGMVADLVTALTTMLEPFEAGRGQVAGYPFAASYAGKLEGLTALRDRLGTDWRAIELDFPEKAEALAQDCDDLAKMLEFAKGSPLQQRWNDVRAFVREGAEEARELGVEPPAGGMDETALRRVAADPECYKSSEIARAARTVKQLNDGIAAAREKLRAQAAAELDAYRASVEMAAGAAAPEAREKLAALFDEARLELSATTRAYKLRSFVTNFKQRNGARLAQLMAPPAPEPEPANGSAPATQGDEAAAEEVVEETAAPKVKQLASVKPRAYAYPFIKTETDVDAYVAALRAELLAQLADGWTIMP